MICDTKLLHRVILVAKLIWWEKLLLLIYSGSVVSSDHTEKTLGETLRANSSWILLFTD